MRDALKSYLALASGLTDISKQRAITAAKALVAQGEATAEQVTSLAEDLVQQSRSNREAVAALVKYELDRALGRVGLASGDEVGELSNRVRQLEAQVRGLAAPAPSAVTQDGSTMTAAKQASPTKASPLKASPAKASPTKAPATKTPATKAATSKATMTAPKANR